MENIALIRDMAIWIIGGLLTIIGFFLRGVVKQVSDLPKEYVLKTDHKEDLKSLKDDFNGRFDKMETHLVNIENDIKQLLKESR